MFWRLLPLIIGRFPASLRLEVLLQPDSSWLSEQQLIMFSSFYWDYSSGKWYQDHYSSLSGCRGLMLVNMKLLSVHCNAETSIMRCSLPLWLFIRGTSNPSVMRLVHVCKKPIYFLSYDWQGETAGKGQEKAPKGPSGSVIFSFTVPRFLCRPWRCSSWTEWKPVF